MFNKNFLQNIATTFLIFITLFSTLTNKSLAQNATVYNGVRDTVKKSGANGCNEKTEDTEGTVTTPEKTCYTSSYDETTGMCERGDFKFDPFGENFDLNWDLSNSSCLGYIFGAGVALKIAFTLCDNMLCPTPPGPVDFKKSLSALTEHKHAELLKKTKDAASDVASSGVNIALMTVAGGGMPLDPSVLYDLGVYASRIPVNQSCGLALGVCGVAVSAAVGALASIWDIAKKNFENTVICGNGWKGWKQDLDQWKTIDGNYATCLQTIFGNTNYCGPGTSKPDGCTQGLNEPECDSIKNKSQDRYCKFINFKDSKSNACSEANVKINNKNNRTEMENQFYREYLYQGIEYVDNGPNACDNPGLQKKVGGRKTKNKWFTTLGYEPSSEGGKQRYYFKGPNQIPNFACSRFLPKDKNEIEALEAFNCCQKNSQKTICLERFDEKDHKFCRRGEECTIFPIKYKIFEPDKGKNYICAKTYTVCPYDHNLQGGTDKEHRYYYRPRITTNFCQYMNHCIKLTPISKPSYFDPNTFFFAESCKDLRGDSQFFNESEIGKISRFSSLYSRNFSTPIVQCLKETLENNFMQKAGKTICKDLNETPEKSKANPDGKCASGYLRQKGEVVKNQTFFAKVQSRFLFPIKIALVLSVVMFGFNILLATPETFINKKTVMTYLVKFGLVYFFAIGNAWQGFFMDSVMNLSTEFSNITFSPKSTRDKNSGDDGCYFPKYNYLSLLETDQATEKKEDLISELQKNPSYPPGKNYLRIWDTLDCKIARAIGYGPNVSVPNLAKMIFAGFLTGGLGIMFFFAAFAYGIMLFSIAIRAIHITIMSIVGVILLIYVSPLTITCALFERTKGIFENWWKQMLGFILQPMILFAYLGLMLTVFDDLFIADATFSDGKINCKNDIKSKSNPEENSVYCILQLSKYESYTGLEVFDLAIPVLRDLNKEKINTLTKAAIIMFVFLKFLDKITYVAKTLVGGAELKGESNSNFENQLKKVAKGVQTRVLNSTSKTIPKAAKKAIRSDTKNPMPKINDDKPPSNKPSSNNDIVSP